MAKRKLNLGYYAFMGALIGTWGGIVVAILHLC